MTKLNLSYKGFAIGFRVADSVAKSYKPGNKTQENMLHAIKSLAMNDVVINTVHLCSINGRIHKA